MNIEDEFHKIKNKKYGTRSLTATFIIKNPEDYKLFKNRAKNINFLIHYISCAEPMFNNLSVTDAINGDHPALKIVIKDDEQSIDFLINHQYCGGSFFVEGVDFLLNNKKHVIPKSNLIKGLLCLVKNSYFYYKLNNSPEVVSNDRYDIVKHYKKEYKIFKKKQCKAKN